MRAKKIKDSKISEAWDIAAEFYLRPALNAIIERLKKELEKSDKKVD